MKRSQKKGKIIFIGKKEVRRKRSGKKKNYRKKEGNQICWGDNFVGGGREKNGRGRKRGGSLQNLLRKKTLTLGG